MISGMARGLCPLLALSFALSLDSMVSSTATAQGRLQTAQFFLVLTNLGFRNDISFMHRWQDKMI